MINGRIIKGIGGLYIIDTKQGEYSCKVRGIFRKTKINPTVGDFVDIDILSEADKEGVISNIYERNNELLRPRVSNVDQSILVFCTKKPVINFDLLDRLIILSEEQNLEIVICINKIDISNIEDYENIKLEYQRIGYKVLCTSTKTNIGIDELISLLDNKVSVFSGQSGVGKSSLVNSIKPCSNMETGILSIKNNMGKHTTRHAQLIKAYERSYIVDSPGFTSLSFQHISPDNLANFFKEFKPFINHCKFNDCKHINEPLCSVKSHVNTQHITKKRYDRYVSLFNELSTKH